jgi:hypothetical protein
LKYVGIGNCKVIYLDTALPPFDKKEVRQAVNMLDRSKPWPRRPHSAPASRCGCTSQCALGVPRELVPTYKYDVQKAKDLLGFRWAGQRCQLHDVPSA